MNINDDNICNKRNNKIKIHSYFLLYFLTELSIFPKCLPTFFYALNGFCLFFKVCITHMIYILSIFNHLYLSLKKT